MKKTVFVLLTLVLLLSLTVSSFALGESMTVKKGVITVDGVIDDVWAQADRQPLTHIKNSVPAPDTSSAYFSALWNGNTLYFLFEVTDDDISFASATAGDWKNDSIYLYLEELGTAGTPYTAGQYQFAFLPAENMSQTPRKGDAAAVGKCNFAYKLTDNGFVIEASYECNMTTLAAGDKLNADVQYNDGTPAATRAYNFGWSDETDAAVSNASVWGTLILSADSVKTAAATTAAQTAASTTAAQTAAAQPDTSAPKTADAAVLVAAIAVAAACAGVAIVRKKH